ncbi:uncharacterized protein PAC_03764 [Phialocephala subalpina]|uniref:Transglycosylase SLT domain-containing protein n=1 Tax=Phialocephala subalpina TaxID=576137 RepID=A0A1L7WM96_9HELO|nr:uncharacterized protein PAC_03764 [Phialocephala subalpina]
MYTMFFTITMLASMALTSPTPLPSPVSPRAAPQASDILLAIAPSSSSCANAPAAGECATAAQAAEYLIPAMAKYEIYNPHEIVAVLSVIAYESGEFKYNTNHFPAPGRPGQGTRNMQMPNFNLIYAQSIPELKTQLAAITTATSTSGLSDATLNAIRALVLPDQYSWASGAWYLTTQCSSVRTQLQAGGVAGWNAYMACIGATDSSETAARLAYWTAANTAFGIS